ncbi:MAG: hypothetical protein HND44_24020 [Chloroflexi bacterium]|nr:hypothetical protein [Ardenticatenaceae bacterium]NOG37606.1 hypothetical protein [Chloroflexota bacterium]
MMSEMQGVTNNNVAAQLEKLARLYQQQQASEVMTRTLDKLLHYETELSQEQLSQLQEKMRQFEQAYHLSSEEFYRRFQAGETDDRMDYVEWASMVQMAHNLQARLDLLTND